MSGALRLGPGRVAFFVFARPRTPGPTASTREASPRPAPAVACTVESCQGSREVARSSKRSMSGSNAKTPAVARGEGTRHLATFLFQASLLGYVALGWLPIDHRGPPLLAVAMVANLVAFLVTLRGPSALRRAVHVAAPLGGIATWTLLAHWSGGAANSLFLAGLWFEIILSGLTHSVRGILVIATLAFAAIWGQQLPLGIDEVLGPLSIQSSLLLLAGATTAWIRHSWGGRQARLTTRLGEEERRRTLTEQELEDARALAVLGERNARLGHELKNAVHSMKGFSTLLQRDLTRAGLDSPALRGLAGSIEQLDVLARETLRPSSNGQPSSLTRAEVFELADETLSDLTLRYPELDCRVEGERATAGRLGVSTGVLAEILTNLIQNGVEAMEGRGELVVRIHGPVETIRIEVSDRGPGISNELANRIFRAGQTTKADGHGMGLYIARRLVEAAGGHLSVGPNEHASPGSTFRISLPAFREV